MDMDMPDKTTQDFDGPGMVSKVDPILRMNINGDDGDDIIFADAGAGIPNPYQQYGSDGANAGGGNAGGDDRSAKGGSRPKSGKKTSSSGSTSKAAEPVNTMASNANMNAVSSGSSRPKSATRRSSSRDGEGLTQVREEYYAPKSGATRK